jgi:hypothetical protein
MPTRVMLAQPGEHSTAHLSYCSADHRFGLRVHCALPVEKAPCILLGTEAAFATDRPLRGHAMNTLRRSGILLLAILVASADVWSTRGQEQKGSARGEFMRQKVEFSSRVLDGLSREDYALIAKNAKALKALSMAAQWEQPGVQEASRYAKLSFQFQDLTDDLVAKADEKNLDGSTLVYTQIVMNCVKCHEYVRGPKKK